MNASCRASLWEWLRVVLMHACVDDTGSEGLPVVVSRNSPATAGEANLPHTFVFVECDGVMVYCLPTQALCGNTGIPHPWGPCLIILILCQQESR
jgi:hypothetical protein